MASDHDAWLDRSLLIGFGDALSAMPPAGELLTHPLGVRTATANGVLVRPEFQVIKEALDFSLWTIEATDEKIAGVAHSPATQIRPMVVVLDQFCAASAQRAFFQTS